MKSWIDFFIMSYKSSDTSITPAALLTTTPSGLWATGEEEEVLPPFSCTIPTMVEHGQGEKSADEMMAAECDNEREGISHRELVAIGLFEAEVHAHGLLQRLSMRPPRPALDPVQLELATQHNKQVSTVSV